ncbi:hypothetical protein [Acetobacter phage phiAP1]|nr:hypothetical protein [Acetobacter phage phiAP1]
MTKSCLSDERMDGSTLKFETGEHDETCTPQCILVTDAHGEEAMYVLDEDATRFYKKNAQHGLE